MNPPRRYYGYITEHGRSCTFYDMIRIDDDEYWATRPDPQRYVMPSKRLPPLPDFLTPLQRYVFAHNVVRFTYSFFRP